LNRSCRRKDIDQWKELSDVDSYYLLGILSYHWKALREKTTSSFFTWQNRTLFVYGENSLLRIRNEISHPSKPVYSAKDYFIWLDSFDEAAKQLGTLLEQLVKDLHVAEKRKILDFLFEKTSNKTLQSPDLPDDIRASVLNTKERLEALPIAAVMAFLEDAQKANRGQHCRDVLTRLQLPTFDEYILQVKEIYKYMTEFNNWKP